MSFVCYLFCLLFVLCVCCFFFAPKHGRKQQQPRLPLFVTADNSPPPQKKEVSRAWIKICVEKHTSCGWNVTKFNMKTSALNLSRGQFPSAWQTHATSLSSKAFKKLRRILLDRILNSPKSWVFCMFSLRVCKARVTPSRLLSNDDLHWRFRCYNAMQPLEHNIISSALHQHSWLRPIPCSSSEMAKSEQKGFFQHCGNGRGDQDSAEGQ